MTFREAVLFVYGVIFATSTPYLKPKNRFLFPTSLVEIDENLKLFLGGSGICAQFVSGSQAFVVNTNQGAAARVWGKRVVQSHSHGVSEFSIALSSLNGAFGDVGTLAALPNIDQLYCSADFGQALDKFSRFPVQHVTREVTFLIGDETVRLIPVHKAATGSDLVVFFEKRSVMMFGALFNNRIHPTLMNGAGDRAPLWIATLEGLLEKYRPSVCVPGEGVIGGEADVREFIRYLRALTDPAIDFSDCRREFDWMEIPSATSLEENFDTLRNKVNTHTSIN